MQDHLGVQGYNFKKTQINTSEKEGTQKAPVPQSLLVPSENIPEDFFSASGLLFYVLGT